MSDAVISDAQSGVLTLTLNRPEQMNALNSALVRGLAEGTRRAAQDTDVRVVVVRGAGQAFCAGADLLEASGLILSGGSGFRDWLLSWRVAFDSFEECSKPVIAAVDGMALAGGLELALACDLIVASERSKFGDVHARFGLVPGGGGSQRLVDAVGTRMARWLMYSGIQIDSTEAHRIGLVQQVYPDADFDGAVASMARLLAGRSLASTEFMKRMSRTALVTTEGLDRELDGAAEVVAGPDALEGLAAFAEKREPRFPSSNPQRNTAAP